MTEWDSIWAHFEFGLSGRCCDAAETLPGRSRDVAGQTRTAFVAGQKIRTADGRDVFLCLAAVWVMVRVQFWSRISTIARPGDFGRICDGEMEIVFDVLRWCW